MLPPCDPFVPIDDAEADCVFSRTRSYKTLDSAVVMLIDLYEGLRMSGYSYGGEQWFGERLNTPPLVITKEALIPALSAITGANALANQGSGCGIGYKPEERGFFTMRLADSWIISGVLGKHASRTLSTEDVLHNPHLTALLVAESYCGYGSLDADGCIMLPRTFGAGESKDAIANTRRWLEQLAYSISNHPNDCAFHVPPNDTRYRAWHEPTGTLRMAVEPGDTPTVRIGDTELYSLAVGDATQDYLDALRQRYTRLSHNPRAQARLSKGIAACERQIRERKTEHYLYLHPLLSTPTPPPKTLNSIATNPTSLPAWQRSNSYVRTSAS